MELGFDSTSIVSAEIKCVAAQRTAVGAISHFLRDSARSSGALRTTAASKFSMCSLTKGLGSLGPRPARIDKIQIIFEDMLNAVKVSGT
jgi:hypothetical protein